MFNCGFLRLRLCGTISKRKLAGPRSLRDVACGAATVLLLLIALALAALRLTPSPLAIEVATTFSAALGGVAAGGDASDAVVIPRTDDAAGAAYSDAAGITYTAYAGSESRALGPAWAARRRGPLDLELVTRTHSAGERMLRGVLLRSLVAFWPPERFGRLVVVLDDEPDDRALGASLEVEQPRLVRAAFANRTLLSKGFPSIRGYHMQQYDTFWMDVFSAATFVGVVDVDSLLVSPPHELDFFDEAGRPRVIPRVETPGGGLWAGSANASAYFVGAWLPRALRESGRPPR